MATIDTSEVFQSSFTGAAIEQRLNAVWPVGSIYLSVDETNPSQKLGFGTWVRIEGKFLYVRTSTDTIALKGTGGSSSVTLTESNLPQHSHTTAITKTWATASGNVNSSTSYKGYLNSDYSDQGTQNYTSSTYGVATPAAINITPPYFAINAWYRSA